MKRLMVLCLVAMCSLFCLGASDIGIEGYPIEIDAIGDVISSDEGIYVPSLDRDGVFVLALFGALSLD